MARAVLHIVDLRAPAAALDWTLAVCRATARRLHGHPLICTIGPSDTDRRAKALAIPVHARIRAPRRPWPTLGRSLRALTRDHAPQLRGVVCWSADVAWLVRNCTPWAIPVAFVPMDDLGGGTVSLDSIPTVGVARPPRHQRAIDPGVPPESRTIYFLAADGSPRTAWEFVFLAGFCEVTERQTAAVLPTRSEHALAAALRFHNASRKPSHVVLSHLPDPHAAAACDVAVWLPPTPDPATSCTPLVFSAIASLARSAVPVVAPIARPLQALSLAEPHASLFLARNSTTAEVARLIDKALTTPSPPDHAHLTPPDRVPDRVPTPLIDRIEKAFAPDPQPDSTDITPAIQEASA